MHTLRYKSLTGDDDDYTVCVSQSVERLKDHVKTQFDDDYDWRANENGTHDAVVRSGYYRRCVAFVIEEIEEI